jgi:hypothetical protein
MINGTLAADEIRRLPAALTVVQAALRVPIIHPCWSGGMLVLVESAAEPVLSSDVQARDPLGIGDRVG